MEDFIRNYVENVAEGNDLEVDAEMINSVVYDVRFDERLWNALDDYIVERLEALGAKKPEEEPCWEDIVRETEDWSWE